MFGEILENYWVRLNPIVGCKSKTVVLVVRGTGIGIS
jgi:hypothetical protein